MHPRWTVAAMLPALVASSALFLGPNGSASRPESVPLGAALPSTGSAAPFEEPRGGEPVSIAVFTQYVPPVPKPRPAVASWTPPAGYRVIPSPIYRQTMPLDCETSALRMGLATFGHYYSDATLFKLEPVDSRAPVMGPNHTVVHWGDPYTSFVGNVWGSDWTPTGYGIYYPIIVSIARSHGLPGTTGGEGYRASTIYAALRAGHPVEVWIETAFRPTAVRTWTAWDGRSVRYSYAEHAVLLSGVSSTSVRVNDPLYGSQYWVSRATFERSWRDFNNMAVIFQ